MKIIHTSDIHLDAAMQTGLSPERAKERRSELMTAFLRLAEYADKAGASAVIIAGDLFDRGRVTAKVRRFVIDTVRGLPDIEFYVLFGNHDAGCFEFTDSLPENLKLFGSEWVKYDLPEGVTVCGVELTGENCESLYGELELDPERVNIAVMHGAVGRTFGEDAVNIKALAEKGIDYLALGHYHSYDTGKIDRRGIYCYPGCLEGRGFDECGDKGFVELDVENGKITHRFVKSSIRTVEERRADMTGACTFAEQLCRVRDALADVPSSSVVRIRAEGKLRPGEEKFFDQIVHELEGEYYGFSVKDRTGVLVDRADYEGDISLKGEFIRLVTEKVKDEEERERIIACGLAALLGGEMP